MTIAAMKSLKELCTPRQSVFDRNRRDVVLDLTDLIQNKIDGRAFFEENYRTDGMNRLLRESFRRFSGDSQQGIFVLSQAMGGGKTHNMLALGLLAKHPELRKTVLGDDFQADLGPVEVVAFTGRESDAPMGIWGAIAEQLGKKDEFKNYYSPLSAPGQSAWIQLLKGSPLLILLDELPPYFENARSVAIGNSDLASVTTTALSNLLVAVSRDELSNVCVVISDLRASYEGGSQQIVRALENLKNEIGRSAITLEPVGMNTNEIYHILRTRLFENLPNEDDVWEVARAYAKAVQDAKQMDITSASPEKFAAQLKDSFPFHFAIRDLYARFRENPGFQQTRGLIRLMRVVVSRLYDKKNGSADAVSLIHAHHIDLNDAETLAEVTQISPNLDNAIGHDIASGGQAVAEILDGQIGGNDARDVSKLLLVSSLANVPNAVVGLSISEIVSYLCAPGRDVSKLPKDIIGTLLTKAWYLHSNRDGKLYFKNVQNLVAKLKTTAESYIGEPRTKELRSFLQTAFAPSMKDCYQEVLALPPVDEIDAKADRVTLIIYEPADGSGFHRDLQKLYDDLIYKNRVLFLSGARGTLEILLETAAELKAIGHILLEMDRERVPDTDPQRAAAKEIQDNIRFRLLIAARETFSTLTYPHGDKLMNTDFIMTFTDNNYNGEKQIRDTLKLKQKFTEDVASEVFRSKCEQRLFTQKVMPWSEVKKRAGMNTQWPWHRPDALDALKESLIKKDQWREEGGYIDKGPFAAPITDLQIQELRRDDQTGMVTLKLTPVHGDVVYYSTEQPVLEQSNKVTEFKNFQTEALSLFFLCVDSSKEHEMGPEKSWKNRITVKSRLYQNGKTKMLELKAAPNAEIKVTMDGADPKHTGVVYTGPVAVDEGTVCVLAVAEKGGIVSDVHRVDVDWKSKDGFKLAPEKPVCWKRRHEPTTTKESYELIGLLKKHNATAGGAHVRIVGDRWIELTVDEKLLIDGEKLENAVNYLRGLFCDGEVAVEVGELQFDTGQQLLDWIAEIKSELKPEEVEQK